MRQQAAQRRCARLGRPAGEGYSPAALSTERDDAVFAAGLPVELADGGWWRATLSTLAALMLRPGASFRAVEEPVSHGPALSFIASLRLPTWGALMSVFLVSWFTAPPDTMSAIKSSIASDLLGLQLSQVASFWLLLMVPLRIPVVYFLAGLWGHIVMALTGGAHRSIGASMRALGFAFAPFALVVGILEVGIVLLDLSPELWAIVFGTTAAFAWAAAAFALARTHETTVVRGLFVALVPLLVFCIDAGGAAAFELAHLPWVPPVDSPYYLPTSP